MKQEWINFKEGQWTKSIDVRNFIQLNYTPYAGDDSFLVGATDATKKLWEEVSELFKKERDNLCLLNSLVARKYPTTNAVKIKIEYQ